MAQGTWSATGEMGLRRFAFGVARLQDGRVLVAGGYERTSQATAEIFDPSRGAWAPAAAMSVPRTSFGLMALSDGSVLAVGGNSTDGDPTNTAEAYDPSADAWAARGAMQVARRDAAFVGLADGRVLVAGGDAGVNNGAALKSSEIYDPSADSWTAAADMNVARTRETATLLSDGHVLVVGGDSGGIDYTPFATAEVYDPVADQWTTVGSMSTPRAQHRAVALADGHVLAIGGIVTRSGSGQPTRSWIGEIYDPATRGWKVAGDSVATEPFHGHTVSLLADGTVLIAAGQSGATVSSAQPAVDAVRFDPTAGTFASAGKTTGTHAFGAAMSLTDGRVLLMGGSSLTSGPSAEIYQP